MNDEKDDELTYNVAKYSQMINGGILSDILYDINTNSISVNTGSQHSNITFSSPSIPNPPALTLKDGVVKIGDLEMEVDQLEVCLKYLLKITKDANPEDFI